MALADGIGNSASENKTGIRIDGGTSKKRFGNRLYIEIRRHLNSIDCDHGKVL